MTLHTCISHPCPLCNQWGAPFYTQVPLPIPTPPNEAALANYKCDWIRVMAYAGFSADTISRAIEMAELNGLFDPVKALTASSNTAEPLSNPATSPRS